LSKILRYNHKERLTAKQAMAHTYFDPVRMEVEHQLHKNRVHNNRNINSINNIGNHNNNVSPTIPFWNS